MKLFEIASTDVPVQVTANYDEKFETTALIGDRTILFVANLEVESKNQWDVFFKEKLKVPDEHWGIWSYDKTGSGEEFKVTSFVISSLRAFVKEKNPSIFEFIASKTEGSRAKIYEKAMKRFFPSFTIERREVRSYEIFRLTNSTQDTE